MNLTVAYQGKSGIFRKPGQLALQLAPNLRRDRVSFGATLREPLRFREAVSALHDVVVNDLRFQPKDKTSYETYLKDEAKRLESLRRAAYEFTLDKAMTQFPLERRQQLQDDYRKCHQLYWGARQKYANYLQEYDTELFRLVVPLDPIITVAPDVVFFECFSADESSYACLSMDRDAFDHEQDVSLGTTNIDYSWQLYDHFQELRSYRETRFSIDPSGFDVQTGGQAGYHEEKIDLPPSWLRGFMQLQAAMSLPMRRVPMSREMVYNLVSYLKRHKAKKSPRALRFELTPGEPVQLVIEPFEQRLIAPDQRYEGGKAETIRTWGRDRLQVVARLLPLMDRADVYLLGTGLPSFWVFRMGHMRLILGLSGWTKNDWTGPSALEQLMPPADPSPQLLGQIAAAFQAGPTQTLSQLCKATGSTAPYVAAGLNRLALLGQVIHDMPARVYRWRQVMPVALSLDQITTDNPEATAARELVRRQQVTITRDETTPAGMRAISGLTPERPTDILIDKDMKITRGKCTCSYFYQFGIRKGPCRHMQALRSIAMHGGGTPSVEQWFASLGADGE